MPEVVQAPCGLCLEERWVARLQVAHQGELIPMALCWRCLMALAASVHLAELDEARRLARWLFERTGFPERPAQVDELLRAHPWLARNHPDLP